MAFSFLLKRRDEAAEIRFVIPPITPTRDPLHSGGGSWKGLNKKTPLPFILFGSAAVLCGSAFFVPEPFTHPRSV